MRQSDFHNCFPSSVTIRINSARNRAQNAANSGDFVIERTSSLLIFIDFHRKGKSRTTPARILRSHLDGRVFSMTNGKSADEFELEGKLRYAGTSFERGTRIAKEIPMSWYADTRLSCSYMRDLSRLLYMEYA